MILILIVAIVLINFYVKRDIYLSSIMGLVLLDVYLIIYYDVVIINLNTMINLEILFTLASFTGVLLVFRKLNDVTSFTNTKDDIRSIFDRILKDKKIKIFTLFLLGSLFSLSPFIGIIYLIFIAILFRISKYNLVLISIFSVFSFNLFNYLLTFKSINIQGNVGIKFISMIYILFLITLIFDKIRKIDKIDKIEIILDILFLLVMFFINIYVCIVLRNLYALQVSIVISMILTWIISVILLNKLPIFVNKEDKERVEVLHNGYLFRMRLPYLTLIIVGLLEIFGFVLCVVNLYIGSIYIIILNGIFIRKFQYLNRHENKINIYKVLTFIIVLYTNAFIINSIIIQNGDIIVRTLNTNIIHLQSPIKYLVNSQDLFIFSNVGFIDNNLTGDVITNIVNLKILLIFKVQLFFSLVMLVAINFVFSFEKREMVHIVTLVIVTSIILQFVIYLY